MKPNELTPSEWMRIITSSVISAKQIASCEGCGIKAARAIVQNINGGHQKNASYICSTDAYLEKYRKTSRMIELRLIYGDKR